SPPPRRRARPPLPHLVRPDGVPAHARVPAHAHRPAIAPPARGGRPLPAVALLRWRAVAPSVPPRRRCATRPRDNPGNRPDRPRAGRPPGYQAAPARRPRAARLPRRQGGRLPPPFFVLLPLRRARPSPPCAAG